MMNDEYNPELEQEEQTQEEVEETTSETEVDSEDSHEVDWKSEAMKWKAIASRKAKRAEESKPKAETTQTNSQSYSEEDIIIISKVADKEKLDSLKEISKLKGLSLAEASETQMFKLAEREIEEKRKSINAQMGASRGSGKRPQEKSFTTPGLTEDEHKAMFFKAIGKN